MLLFRCYIVTYFANMLFSQAPAVGQISARRLGTEWGEPLGGYIYIYIYIYICIYVYIHIYVVETAR